MNALPEELLTFVEVLTEDEDLRAWFESWAATPDSERALEFHRLAERMQAAGEAPELIRATVLLAHPDVFHAAEIALREALDAA